MWSPKLHLLHSVAFHHYLCYVIDISPKQWNWCFFLLRLPSSLSFWKYSAWCLINLCWTNNNFFFLFSFYFTFPNIFCFLLFWPLLKYPCSIFNSFLLKLIMMAGESAHTFWVHIYSAKCFLTCLTLFNTHNNLWDRNSYYLLCVFNLSCAQELS